MIHFADDWPDPPGNPDFETLPEEFRERVAARFDAGISKREWYDEVMHHQAENAWCKLRERLANLRKRDLEMQRASRSLSTVGEVVKEQTKTRRGRRGKHSERSRGET